MKLVPYGELGVPCSQEYLASLTTSDKINKEIDKISLSDYEPVTRTEDNNDVVEPQSYIEWLNNRLDELKQLEAEKQAQIEAQKKQQEEEQKAKKEAEKQKVNILESKETSNTQEEYKSLTQEEYQSLILKLQQKDALIERLLKYAQSLKNNSNTQCEDVQSSDKSEDVQSSDKSEDEPPASNEESKDVHLDNESQESLDSEDDTSTVYESNN